MWHADLKWPIGPETYKRRFSAVTEAEAMEKADEHIEYLKNLYKHDPGALNTLGLSITKEENDMEHLKGKEVMFIKSNGEAVNMLVTGFLGTTIMGEDEGQFIQIDMKAVEDYLVMAEAE